MSDIAHTSQGLELSQLESASNMDIEHGQEIQPIQLDREHALDPSDAPPVPQNPDAPPAPQNQDAPPAPQNPDAPPAPQNPDAPPAPQNPGGSPEPQNPGGSPAPQNPGGSPAPQNPGGSPAPQNTGGPKPNIFRAAIALALFLGITLLYIESTKTYDFGGSKLTTWLYFSAATLSGIGYGRIQPTESLHRVLTGALQLIGQGLVSLPLHAVAAVVGTFLSKKFKCNIQRRKKILAALGLVALVVMFGTWIVHEVEKQDLPKAFYSSVGITTGIGQNDFPLKKYLAQWFTIVWIMFARTSFTQAMQCICKTWLYNEQ